MSNINYRYEPFEGYVYRVKFIAEDSQGFQMINRDIYTDCTVKEKIENYLNGKARRRGLIVDKPFTGVVHFSTKEQDDNISKFLDDL